MRYRRLKRSQRSIASRVASSVMVMAGLQMKSHDAHQILYVRVVGDCTGTVTIIALSTDNSREKPSAYPRLRGP